MRRMTLVLGVATAVAALTVGMFGTAQGATPKYGKCKPTGKYNSVALKTVKGDTLTVGYVTIAPAHVEGQHAGLRQRRLQLLLRGQHRTIAPGSRRSCSGRSTSRSS